MRLVCVQFQLYVVVLVRVYAIVVDCQRRTQRHEIVLVVQKMHNLPMDHQEA